MGTFAEFIGEMNVPENHRAEYARQMLKLLHAGGMMSVDKVGLFGHRIRLLYPPEFDETGRAWGCYNYFENDFWESWGLNVDTGTFSSNKIGGRAFCTAVLAGYVLTALSCQSYGIVTVDGSYVREHRFIGWINGVLGTQYTDWRSTQLWEIEKLLHKDGCEEYNKDLTGLIHDVPTACADLGQVESYIAARFFEEFYADMSAEEEDVEIYHKEDAIGVRNCFVHLKKTLSALHENGGTLEEAKKYLLMPMDERSAVIDEQGGNTLAFSYCFVSPALAVAMTAREFGVVGRARSGHSERRALSSAAALSAGGAGLHAGAFRCCHGRHGVLLAVGRQGAVFRRDGGVDAVAPRGAGRDHQYHSAGEVSASYGGCHRRCGKLRFSGHVLRVHRAAGGAEGAGCCSSAGAARRARRAEYSPVFGDSRESRAAGDGVRFLNTL